MNTSTCSTLDKVLYLLVLVAREAGATEEDIARAWCKTPDAPVPQEKRGLDALFDQPAPVLRHRCVSCGKIRYNRQAQCTCKDCSVPMVTSAIRHGKRGRPRKIEAPAGSMQTGGARA